MANFREKILVLYKWIFWGGRQKIVLFHRKDSFFRDEIYENRHSFLDMKLSKITFSLHFFIHWICLLIRRTCLWYKKWHTFFWLTSPIQTRKSSSGLWGKLQSLDFFQEVSHKQLKQNGKCMKNCGEKITFMLTFYIDLHWHVPLWEVFCNPLVRVHWYTSCVRIRPPYPRLHPSLFLYHPRTNKHIYQQKVAAEKKD